MKRKYIVSILFLLGFSAYSEQVNLLSVSMVAVTHDSVDPWKYSPLKAFDKNSLSCFAVPEEKVLGSILFRLHFEKAIPVDTIAIESGLFDKIYYYSNYRIKTIRIRFNQSKGTYWGSKLMSEEIYEFVLEDTMEIHYISLPKVIYTNEISFEYVDLYETKKDRDICISEIEFYYRDTRYSVNPDCYRFGKTDYFYNDYNEIVKSISRRDHFSATSYWYNHDGSSTIITCIDAYEDSSIDTTITKKYINELGDHIEVRLNRGEEYYRKTDYYSDGVLLKTIINYKESEIEIYYYYNKEGVMLSDSYGEYIYKDGILVGYFSYRYDYIDSEIGQKMVLINYLHPSYVNIYNEKKKIITVYDSAI